ncbi:putative sporulation protein YtxC [Clostridium botulinum C]|uniref:Sporulation protein YtxC n=3 Tax=Clostridium botulinum TaxID=1491 RepID=A0A9Q4XR69_CLOBO|nr:MULTISPECIES: putative sporulation protein YtxC [Clostridium]EGO87322.1 sporulation protein [Clostridium botulinum C str. Stockholm]MBO3442623.1 putative sporulation protein YtxC [Clostridium haemolyticum]MCD3193942.1 putative sporulation protein YtxC [Clostridium botulinum C]EES90835.1 putative sporulation protein YtxC [Clostridium botulinum D str. 1873]KEI07126.1 sporulation protein [Clostridium sp. K25]
MLLLTIICDDKEDIVDGLNEMKRYFEEKNIILGISESMSSRLHFIKIFCSEFELSSKLKNKFSLYIANIIYNIVVKEFYREEMYSYLTDSYFFLKYEEMQEVINRSIEILSNSEKITDEDTIYCMNKKNDIIDKIKECIDENDTINIRGFITFRMKQLRKDFECIVSKVVEKYIAKKEYDEFIKLLKYFVDIQESKIKELNIIIQNDGSYLIQDENKKDMMEDMFKELTGINSTQDVEDDDLIISGLITYCPENIVIYNKENSKNKEMINTIEEVFKGRVKFCEENKKLDKIKNTIKV